MRATASSPRVGARELLLTITLAFLLFSWAGAQPNEDQRKLREGVHKLCERSIKSAFSRIRPLIADDYSEIANRQDLVVFAPYGEFNALAIYQEKRVVITWGFCDQIWLVLSCALIGELFPDYRDKLNPYVKYVSDRTLAIERTAPKGRLVENEVLTFPLYAGIDVRRITQPQLDMVWGIVSEAMPNAMAFAIAHEIGHLALRHRDYNAIPARESRAQEFAADRFASRIMSSLMGNEFDPTFTTSLLLLLFREAGASPNPTATHPPTHCRLGRVMLDVGVIDRIKEDPGMSRDFQRRTGYTPHEVIRLLREMRDDCRK